MRLWSLHPRYLDRAGLLALWREGLLAQAVLSGRTRGYRHHPQLRRFREHPSPLASIAAYLQAVHAEATRRGYRFDITRIRRHPPEESPFPAMAVTAGQLAFEKHHLLAKLRRRNPACFALLAREKTPQAHPVFVPVAGGVEEWERTGRSDKEKISGEGDKRGQPP